MTDGVSLKPPGLVRGRPFAKGPANRPAGRRAGSRNKKDARRAVLLEGEAEALTRRAVELALAAGVITPGEAGTIAAVVDTFVRAIETSDFDRRLKTLEADLPAGPGDAPGTFDAEKAGNSTYWEDLALNWR